MSTTLTFDVLLDMAAKLRGHRALRIISGAPFIPRDEAKQFDDGQSYSIMFLGAGVVEAIERIALPSGQPDVAAASRFTGIEIEPWGSRPDHSRIAARIAGRMLAAPDTTKPAQSCNDVQRASEGTDAKSLNPHNGGH